MTFRRSRFWSLLLGCIFFVAALGIFPVPPADATVYSVAFNPKFKAFDPGTGNPLASGKLYTYLPNTTTLVNTYKDYAGAATNTNPIVLDANGECDLFFNGWIKLALYDANNVLVWTKDNLAFGALTNNISADNVFLPVGDNTFSVNDALTSYIDVGIYGAGKDNTAAQNTTAIRAAIAAASAGNTVKITAPGTYSLDNTITINKSINFIMEPGTTISYSGPAGSVAFDVTGAMQLRTLVLDVSRTADWTAGSVGVQMDYINGCNIYVRQASGFETGFYVNQVYGGYPTGNHIKIGNLWSNRYGFRMNAAASPAGGVNQNRVEGGYISCAETVNPTLDRYGIYLDNNVTGTMIYGPVVAVLGNTGNTGKAYSMVVASGSANRVIGGTLEGADYILKATGTAQYNKITANVATAADILRSAAIVDTSDHPGTNTVEWWPTDAYPQEGVREVFTVADVYKRAIVNQRSGANVYYSVPGFTFLNNSGAYTNYLVSASTDNISVLAPTFFRGTTTATIGRVVDTSAVKDFWVTATRIGATAGDLTLLVKAYADNGALLTGGSDIVGGSPASKTFYPLVYGAGKGGSYLSGYTDTARIRAGDNVASMWIGIGWDGTANGKLTGISFMSPANQAKPHSRPGYGLIADGAYFDSDTSDLHASAQPIGGVFDNGTRIWSTVTDNGATMGWGVVGRQTTTANGGEPAAETTVALASIVGMAASDIMGVVITQDNSSIQKWHWTSINGAPADNNAVMTHAVPTGWTIANGAKVITYRLKTMPNLGAWLEDRWREESFWRFAA